MDRTLQTERSQYVVPHRVIASLNYRADLIDYVSQSIASSILASTLEGLSMEDSLSYAYAVISMEMGLVAN